MFASQIKNSFKSPDEKENKISLNQLPLLSEMQSLEAGGGGGGHRLYEFYFWIPKGSHIDRYF